MCSLGVCFVPFFALDTGRVSLNSGLSREHVCCHVFLPAHVFPSGLGNTPVTEIGGSPFPHGGVSLDVGGFTWGSVVCNPTACNNDAGIISICSSASTLWLAYALLCIASIDIWDLMSYHEESSISFPFSSMSCILLNSAVIPLRNTSFVKMVLRQLLVAF